MLGLLWTLRFFAVITLPLAIPATKYIVKTLDQVTAWGIKSGRFTSGDRLVLVAGIGLASAAHNLAMVHEVK